MQPNGVNMVPGVRWDAIDKTEEVYPVNVASYVKRGWVILMAYNRREDVYESVYENGCHQQRIRCEYRAVVLMGQTNLDFFREENERLTCLNVELSKSDKQHQELKKHHEVMSRNLIDVQRRQVESEEQNSKLSKRSSEYEAQKRKLEVDISKIRAALGEIRMKEILGP